MNDNLRVEWEVVKDKACCACAKNAARTLNYSLNRMLKTRFRTVVLHVHSSRIILLNFRTVIISAVNLRAN